MQIVSSPSAVTLSGSPILFILSSIAVGDFYRIIATPDASGSDILPLNSEQKAIFDLHEYFSGTRESEFVLDNVYIHGDHCKPAVIQIDEYYGNPPEVVPGITHNLQVAAGSIPRWKEKAFKQYSSFLDFLTLAKPLLTWYPRTTGKKILPDQPERLYFLNILPSQVLKLQLKLYFDDNTIQLMDPLRSIQVDQYKVVSFASGYDALALSNAGKKVVKYDAWISTAAGDAISEVFTYLVDDGDYRNKRFIIFRNSLYGYDILSCTGEFDELSEVERNTADRVADISDLDRLHKIEYRREFNSIVKINTGWLNYKEKEWLNDLFISDEIHELKDGMMNRILIKSKQLDTTDRSFSPGEVEIEYERLFLA